MSQSQSSLSTTMYSRHSLLLVLNGYLILLLGSYVDNTRGPLIPLFVRSLGITYEEAGSLLVIGCFASMLTSASFFFLLRYFHENTLGQVTCGLGLLLCVMSTSVDWFLSYFLFAVMVGVVVSAAGTLCNIFVMASVKEGGAGDKLLSGLHTMYGIGSLLGAYFIGVYAEENNQWPNAYYILSAGFVLLWAMLVWERRLGSDQHKQQKRESVPLSLSFIQILLIFCFSIYVAAEVLTAMWMSSYLVEVKGFTAKLATQYTTGFFSVLMGTRILCFLFAKQSWQSFLILSCLVLSAVSIFLGIYVHPLALCFAGLFGPFFPLFLARVNRFHPKKWKALAVWLIFSMQLTLALLHFTVSKLSQSWGFEKAYHLPLVFLAILIPALLWLMRTEKNP